MEAFAAGELRLLVVDDGGRGRRRRAERHRDGRRARRALRAVAAAPAARPRRPRTAPGHCVLLYQSPLTDDARERLKAMTETADGFAIAERDLALRGPGDFFGTRQAGMPTLRDRRSRARRGDAGAGARRSGALAGRDAPPTIATLAGSPRRLGRSLRPGPRRVASSSHAHHRRHAEGPPPRRADMGGPAADVRQAARDAVQHAPGPRWPGRASSTAIAGTGAVGIEALSRGAAARHLRRAGSRGRGR